MPIVRGSISDSWHRILTMLRRGVAESYTDKNRLMQTAKNLATFHGYTHDEDVEIFQPVGISVTPLNQDKDQNQQQSQTSQSQYFQSNQKKGKAAECIVAYLSPDHPVVICRDDRRVRPYDIKPGNGFGAYSPDGTGRGIYHKDKGTYHVVTNNPPYNPETGKQDGQQVQRAVYLRHARKTVQTRDLKDDSGASQSTGSQQSGQADYKHEGEHVNTEVSNDENLHQVNVNYDEGTNPQKKIVAQYNVSGKQWDWNVDGAGQVTRVMNEQKIHDTSPNHYAIASQTYIAQGVNSTFFGTASNVFGSDGVSHWHGGTNLTEIINLGHKTKGTLASNYPNLRIAATFGDDVILDTGISLSASTSSATAPSEPDLDIPYNGFRWIDTTSGIEYSYYEGIWSEGGGSISFPGSPTVGQTFDFQGRQWKWNDIGWESTTIDAKISGIPAPLFKRLASDRAYANNTNAQAWFASDFNVDANSNYVFEGLIRVFFNTGGGINGNILFAGTATVSSIIGTISSKNSDALKDSDFVTSTGALLVMSLNNSNDGYCKISGNLRTGASAGTFIPQWKADSNPNTGSYFRAGTYFKLSKTIEN